MKKFFMSLAAVAVMALAAGFVSCDPNKTQCWLLIATFPQGGTQEMYFYGSGVEADAQLEILHQAGATKIERKQTFLSKENCHK
jgi:hypothetical protein